LRLIVEDGTSDGHAASRAIAPEVGGTAEEELAYRLHQQALLAELGLFVLRRPHDIDTILNHACRLCAQGLQTRLCKVAEWVTENRLLVRAGVGWRPGVVGTATLGADLDSPAGYALLSGEPVISNHLAQETRFRTPQLLADHGVKRAINVLIPDGGRPFGVLEADSREEGRFTTHDVAFMQGIAALVGVAIERHEATTRLAESERAFRATFEQAAVGIAHVALDGSWLRVNDRLCTILGYRRAELLSLTFQDITHPDDLARDVAQVQALLAGKVSTYSMEKRYIRKGGDAVWANLTVSVAHDDDGRPLHFISVIEDISARKQTERKLQELTASLEQRVDQRTVDLAEANRRLEAEMAERTTAQAALRHAEKMKALGELTGGIAHDFNNVLTAIGGNLELARRGADAGVRRRLDLARQGVQRGAQLARDLLSFARKTPLEPTVFDVADRVRGIREMLDRALGDMIRVEADLGTPLSRVRADADQLDLAILNAAVNARDAMPDGGTFRITARDIHDGRDRPWVEISLSDSGTGMPPEVIERAFEPFFTTKQRGEGTGLGLAQIYAFAVQSGGTASIESAPGEGTRVIIRLPAAAD
jgi:PAS domain S-box-containing protein